MEVTIETVTILESMGFVVWYTKDSYKRLHQGRNPEEDNIIAVIEKINNVDTQVYKTVQGELDVWRKRVESRTVVRHTTVYDTGRNTIAKGQQSDTYQTHVQSVIKEMIAGQYFGSNQFVGWRGCMADRRRPMNSRAEQAAMRLPPVISRHMRIHKVVTACETTSRLRTVRI